MTVWIVVSTCGGADCCPSFEVCATEELADKRVKELEAEEPNRWHRNYEEDVQGSDA